MATAKKAKPAAPKKAKTTSAKAPKAAAKAPKAAAKAPKAAAKAPKAAAKPAAGTMKPIKETLNKTGLVSHLAEASGVEPKAVKAVLAALEGTMAASINKKGAGAFVLPGLLKVTAVAVPARKARKGINPFTKEETVFKAKPATVKLKVRPLKKLKDAVL
ncbi:HU family DNA-binding protein [Ramlibacter tataouinensis]|uniref:HU family DNA-binding protein n=1 Tax=Ramlibacter tataouinensis TaxID=94132 RepID=UPI0022F3A6DF|nr:HU family DNA-binding protein [Ramlibacter tataouinensis]WBY03149.1 HU family DNA-binding protein [Ramlibacter tataouinensis]